MTSLERLEGSAQRLLEARRHAMATLLELEKATASMLLSSRAFPIGQETVYSLRLARHGTNAHLSDINRHIEAVQKRIDGIRNGNPATISDIGVSHD